MKFLQRIVQRDCETFVQNWIQKEASTKLVHQKLGAILKKHLDHIMLGVLGFTLDNWGKATFNVNASSVSPIVQKIRRDIDEEATRALQEYMESEAYKKKIKEVATNKLKRLLYNEEYEHSKNFEKMVETKLEAVSTEVMEDFLEKLNRVVDVIET